MVKYRARGESMRLFIAADLSEELRDALAESSAALRESLRGRFVPPSSHHLTLAFLGELPSGRIAELESIIAEVAFRHEPIGLRLGSLGSFGPERSSVLWQGFEESPELQALAAELRAELRQADFSFDAKGFLPHVTLMRQARLLGGELPGPCLGQGLCDAMLLVRSHLGGPSPRYEELARFELGGRPSWAN